MGKNDGQKKMARRPKVDDPEQQLTTKQRFVEAAYHIIAEEGFESATARAIAQRVGCTATTLYRHFDNMDYLVMLASIRFLDRYAEDLVEIARKEKDPVAMEIKAWRAFNQYAFANPPVFLHIFWGPCSSSFEDAVVEYSQLFPEQPGNHDETFYGYYFTAIFTGSMAEREFVWLRRAAALGELDLEDARYISIVNNNLVRGLLLDHLNDYRKPDRAEKAAAECNALIEKTIRTFLKHPFEAAETSGSAD